MYRLEETIGGMMFKELYESLSIAVSAAMREKEMPGITSLKIVDTDTNKTVQEFVAPEM